MSVRIIEAAYLYYKKGTADKVYELFLDQDESTYIVRAYYGRRNSVLLPVEKYRGGWKHEAYGVYEKVYNEKIGKGYQQRSGGPLASHHATLDKAPHQANTKKAKVAPVVRTRRNITLGEL